MTEEEAIAIIEECLVGPASIPVKLRLREGLDRAALANVRIAVAFLVEHWKDRPDVPKSVAAAVVDIGNTVTWANGGYPESEQEEIEAAAMELVELAYSLFE